MAYFKELGSTYYNCQSKQHAKRNEGTDCQLENDCDERNENGNENDDDESSDVQGQFTGDGVQAQAQNNKTSSNLAAAVKVMSLSSLLCLAYTLQLAIHD